MLSPKYSHLMATLLPSITTGLKAAAGSWSGPALDRLPLGLQPRGTSLGLPGTLLLPWVRVWQIFISSSRMLLVWASWSKLSSTLRMSLWEYPSLRKRSTLAWCCCCCCWSIVDSSSEYSLLRVFSGLPARGIPLASLLWYLSVSRQRSVFRNSWQVSKAEAVTVNTGSTRAVSQGGFWKLDCGLVQTDWMCSGYQKLMTFT